MKSAVLFLLFAALQRSALAIYVGSESQVGQFKYHVGLVDGGSVFCQGALISDTFVLTAALCVDGRSSVEVHLGAHDITDLSEEGRVVVESTQFVVHEEYNEYFGRNDLALVILPEPVSGQNIEAIRLPSRSSVGLTLAGIRVVISGWGKKLLFNATGEAVLNFGKNTVITNSDCSFANGGLYVRDIHICLNDIYYEIPAPCELDQGSPMAWLEDDGESTLVGVSGQLGRLMTECTNFAPSIFTRTSEFLDWIQQNSNVEIRP